MVRERGRTGTRVEMSGLLPIRGTTLIQVNKKCFKKIPGAGEHLLVHWISITGPCAQVVEVLWSVQLLLHVILVLEANKN